MLTIIKKFYYTLKQLQEFNFLLSLKIRHWYLIKFRKMRHLNIDFAATKKFFIWTFANFFIFKYFLQYWVLIFNILFNTLFSNQYNKLQIYNLLLKWGFMLEQLIDITSVYATQFWKWGFLDCFFITEFSYNYEKIDKKKKWIQYIRYLIKKYTITVKFYSGKITHIDGIE